METRVGLGDKKERKEDEELPGLGFGRGSDPISFAPRKLIRTAGLPFLSSCTSGDGSSVLTSTPSLSSDPTLFLNDDYDGGRALQPFPTPFISPGVGMDVGGCDLRGFLFTSAQWQELQRQALIYKHIISSAPVPPDLLFSNSPPHHLLPNLMAGRGDRGTFNLGFSNGMDPESGRCRRTDGKKWRCSRNAAPDQKYCERHMHRGRPRSRKPVEVSKTKRTSTNTLPITANSPTIVTTTTTTTTTSLSKPLPSQSSGLFPKDELESPFQSLEPNREPRSDGMKGNGEEMESSLRWELMHSKIGLRHGTTPPVLQYHEGQLNLNYAAFLNPDLCSLEENAIGNRGEASRSFIDAWSSETPAATAEDGNSTTSVPTTGELPLSTLTLSMSSTGEGTDHQIQMAPVSPFGGPLGEALQTSSATSPRHGFGANGRDSSSGGLISILSHGFHGSHEVSPQVGFLSFWSPAESLGFAFRQQ